MILISAGRGMDQRIALRDQLVRGTVADAMRPPPPTVPIEMSLVQALDGYLRGADGQAFPVVDAGKVVGDEVGTQQSGILRAGGEGVQGRVQGARDVIGERSGLTSRLQDGVLLRAQ